MQLIIVQGAPGTGKTTSTPPTDFTRVDYDRILNYVSMAPEEDVSSS